MPQAMRDESLIGRRESCADRIEMHMTWHTLLH